MDTGELIEQALDNARDDEAVEAPEVVATSWQAKQADAFVNLVDGYLSGGSGVTSDNYLVTVHVDREALQGREGRAGLPIETVKRHCCDGQAVVITEDEKGEPLSIGRKSRIVPKAIQRAVRSRDKNCCTFPGCRNQRFLHCHHVEHWSNGGETSLDNLMLLCTRHHTLVHEGGFRIEKDYRDNWCFVKPDGIAVRRTGYVSGTVENPPAGRLLSIAENQVSERAPPAYLH